MTQLTNTNPLNDFHPRNVYVAGLPSQYTDEALSQLFSQYGVVESARIMRCTAKADVRQVGFVLLRHPHEADLAIAQLHGHILEGEPLIVRRARISPPPGKQCRHTNALFQSPNVGGAPSATGYPDGHQQSATGMSPSGTVFHVGSTAPDGSMQPGMIPPYGIPVAQRPPPPSYNPVQVPQLLTLPGAPGLPYAAGYPQLQVGPSGPGQVILLQAPIQGYGHPYPPGPPGTVPVVSHVPVSALGGGQQHFTVMPPNTFIVGMPQQGGSAPSPSAMGNQVAK